jgi:nicotinamide riboside transporter PnuC
VNNPYEAPKSDVRDVEPQRLLVERPRQVVHATLSFWVSILISITLIYLESEQAPEDPVETVFVTTFLGLILVLMAVANVAMWRGRNWARIVFLILSVLSVVIFVLELRETLKSTVVEIVLTVASTALDVMVSYLLFTKPGSLWFRTVQKDG